MIADCPLSDCCVKVVTSFLELEKYFGRDTLTHPEDEELSVKEELCQIIYQCQPLLALVNSHQADITFSITKT